MTLFSPFALTRKVFLTSNQNTKQGEINDNFIDKINDKHDEIITNDICEEDDIPKPISEEDELMIKQKLWLEKELYFMNNHKINEFKKQELNLPRLNQTFILNNNDKNINDKNDICDKYHEKPILNRSMSLSKIKKENLSFEENLSLLQQNLNKISMNNELSETIKLYKKYHNLFKELDKQAEEIKQIIKDSPY